MKKALIVLSFVVLISAAGFSGCAKKAATSKEAIQQAQTLKTAEEKIHYLVNQANAFINSKEFDQAIKTAQYILSNLDANSKQAKSLLERAKEELKKNAQAAVNDVKKKLNF